jgi:hypothetical protein
MSKEVSLRASGNKMKAPGMPAKGGAGKVKHIMIEPGVGGVTSKTFMHPPAGMQSYDMPDPTPMIHTDGAALGAHLVSQMPDSFPKPKAKLAAKQGKGAAAQMANNKNAQEADEAA